MADNRNLAPVPLRMTNNTSTNGSHSTNGASINTSYSLDLRARFSGLKSTEDAKNTLIEDTFSRYDAVCRQIDDLLKQKGSQSTDHTACQDREKFYEEREKIYQQQLMHFQRLLNREPFVLILIDGIKMIFHEVFLQDGEKGGRKAALVLKDDISEWIPGNIISPPSEYKIMIMVYADFKLCAKIYGSSVFEEFARGFNSVSNFIDIGGGDASEKLMDQFKLFLYNYHCHQLLLGCDHKKLNDYHNDAEAQHRVTLLQSTKFEKVGFPFKTAQFPRVFGGNKTNIVSATTSRAATPAYASSPSLAVRSVNGRTMTSSVTAADEPADSWAKRAHAAVALPQTSMLPRVTSTSGVRRNKKGQRIDPPIEFDPDEHHRIKKLKLCNKHYLHPQGCPPTQKCQHNHDYHPTSSEIKALRQVSREVVCNEGVDCDDPFCVYGHRCPYPVAKEGTLRGLGCINGSGCRFPREMHGIKA
ncbi:hypothetical protein Q7P37_001850 [Cladosporium fusiforme]